jgi:hypothetical protein
MKNKDKKCDEIKCKFCDDITGIIKCIDKSNNEWTHLICANWIPDVYFTDETKSKLGGECMKDRLSL